MLEENLALRIVVVGQAFAAPLRHFLLGAGELAMRNGGIENFLIGRSDGDMREHGQVWLIADDQAVVGVEQHEPLGHAVDGVP